MALHDRDYMRDTPSRQGWSGPSAFQVILGLNVAVFVAQHVFGLFGLTYKSGFYPYGGISAEALGRGQAWTVLTHMFVHGNAGHLFLNILLLWVGGRGVQQLFGGLHFTLIYLFSGMVGAAAEMTVNGLVHHDVVTPLIGASASAFGLLTALAVRIPAQEVTAFIYFIIPVRMRLWTLAKVLCALQLVLGVACIFFDFMPQELKIAYFAHVGGAAAGWFYARSLGYGGRALPYVSQWQPEPFRASRQPEMARARRRRTIDLEEEAAPPSRPVSSSITDPVESLMESVVNPLLDKINLHGKDSLTEEEQRLLKNASDEVTRHRGQS